MNDVTSAALANEQAPSPSEARHGAAHALGYVLFGVAFDSAFAQGMAKCGATGSSGEPDARIDVRIALLGPCAALLGEIEEYVQPAMLSESLFAWADDVVNGGGYSDDLLATRGLLEAEIVWALAFVDLNYDLIAELSLKMLSSYPDAVGLEECTALVGARILEPDSAALEAADLRLAGSLVLQERIDTEVLARV